MQKETTFQIPPEGSLGLLALGHIGLIAWRKARIEYEEKTGERFESFYTNENSSNVSALDHYKQSEHES